MGLLRVGVGLAVLALNAVAETLPPDLGMHLQRTFDRLEASRNRATGGVGLGLTIARDIARAHGGDLTLHNAKPIGLIARLEIAKTL